MGYNIIITIKLNLIETSAQKNTFSEGRKLIFSRGILLFIYINNIRYDYKFWKETLERRYPKLNYICNYQEL